MEQKPKQSRYNKRHFFNNQKKRIGRIQKFISQLTATKSHCHSRHVRYNELGTQNTKSKSITSKIYICNDKTFFYSYITKQAPN